MGSSVDGSLLHSIGLDHDQAQQQGILEIIKNNQTNVILFVIFIFIALRQLISNHVEARKANAQAQFLDAPGFPEIQRLENFKWQEQEPLKLRFFKEKYFLTMGECPYYVEG